MGDSITSGDSRPPIPADIRRRVLVEAGHRCAIPTCRHIDVDVHHIIEWAKAKAHEYDNLIALCPNCHRRAHKGDIDRKSLRLYKLNLRFAHDKFSQLEIDLLFKLQRAPSGLGVSWPSFMKVLIDRILEAGYVIVHEPQDWTAVGGLRTTPDILTLSPLGHAFLCELGHADF